MFFCQWATGFTSLFVRHPPRGPRTPVSSPTLLLVTQDHRVSICYLRHYIPSLKIITCSLVQPGTAVENQPNSVDEPPSESQSVRQCVHAAIGLGYNGDSPAASLLNVAISNLTSIPQILQY